RLPSLRGARNYVDTTRFEFQNPLPTIMTVEHDAEKLHAHGRTPRIAITVPGFPAAANHFPTNSARFTQVFTSSLESFRSWAKNFFQLPLAVIPPSINLKSPCTPPNRIASLVNGDSIRAR